MTVSADAINRPIFAASPRQNALRDHRGLSDIPYGVASERHASKLVPLSVERQSAAAWRKSAANSSSEARLLDETCNQNSSSVYDRIKLSLLQRPWIPGELLQIGMFARELDTSTTPVREALIRLAAERLIAYAPKKGFFVKTMTEEDLRGLYLVNQMHVEMALYCSCERAANVLRVNSNGFTQIPSEPSDIPEDLAFVTANLFLIISALADIEEIMATVCNINNRLHRPRMAECLVIDGTSQELSSISDLFATGECDKLHEAIRRYHTLRLQMLPSMCKELLSMSFVKR